MVIPLSVCRLILVIVGRIFFFNLSPMLVLAYAEDVLAYAEDILSDSSLKNCVKC